MTTTSVDLSPTKLDLLGIRAGDRNLLQITLKQNGVAINLTGQTIAAQARQKVTDTAIALSGVIVVLNAAGGVITLSWAGDAVRTLLAGKATWSGVWDMQLGPAGVDPETVLAGKFVAALDVTRP